MRTKLGFAVVAGLLLTGCQSRITTNVDVKPNGSGKIAVAMIYDSEAASLLPSGDPLGLSALRSDGWTVKGPAKSSSGQTLLTVSHGFSDNAQATNLLRSLVPPFGGLTVKSTNRFVYSSASISGTIDLSKGLISFVPEGQQEQLSQSTNSDFKKFIDTSNNVSIRLAVSSGTNRTSTLVPLGTVKQVSLKAGGVNTGVWFMLAAIVFAVMAWLLSRRGSKSASGSNPAGSEFSMT